MKNIIAIFALIIPCLAEANIYVTTISSGPTNAITFAGNTASPMEIRTAAAGQESSTTATGSQPLSINAGLRGVLNLNTISTGAIVMSLNPSSNVGIKTSNPALPLDVNGAAQFGSTLKSTFSASGSLTLANGASLILSGANGNITTASSVTASAFYGDGSHLTGSSFNGGVVANQTTFQSSVTIQNTSGIDSYVLQVGTGGVSSNSQNMLIVSTTGIVGISGVATFEPASNGSRNTLNMNYGDLSLSDNLASGLLDLGYGTTGQVSLFNLTFNGGGAFVFPIFDVGSGLYMNVLNLSTSVIQAFAPMRVESGQLLVDNNTGTYVAQMQLNGYGYTSLWALNAGNATGSDFDIQDILTENRPFNVFTGAPTDSLDLTPSGVGVGTSNPGAALEVANGDVMIDALANCSTSLQTDSSGNIICAPSDRSLKHDIKPIHSNGAAYDQLRPSTWIYNDAARGTKAVGGLIADEVEPLFPDVVTTAGYELVKSTPIWHAPHMHMVRIYHPGKGDPRHGGKSSYYTNESRTAPGYWVTPPPVRAAPIKGLAPNAMEGHTIAEIQALRKRVAVLEAEVQALISKQGSHTP